MLGLFVKYGAYFLIVMTVVCNIYIDRVNLLFEDFVKININIVSSINTDKSKKENKFNL